MKIQALTVSALAACLALPQAAQAQAGALDVKIFATYVVADGKISELEMDGIGLPSGTASTANHNVTPTVALQYFVTDAISLETIAGLTQHDVDGRGALAGSELASNVKILPATVTVKYHFGKDGGPRPYVGAGPTYFFFIDEKSGGTTQSLGADRLKINDKFGLALQAGIDIPVSDKGLMISFDAKRYLMRTTATWYADGTEILKTRQRLDPWLLSAGVGFRF